MDFLRYLKQVFWRWEGVVSGGAFLLLLAGAMGARIPGQPWVFAAALYGALIWATYEVHKEVLHQLPKGADIVLELSNGNFGGHGWSRSPSMPTPPLRLIGDAILSNRGDETGLVTGLRVVRLGPQVRFLEPIEGRISFRRGRDRVTLPLEVTAGEIMADLQIEAGVNLAVSTLEFAQQLREADRFDLEIVMEQRTLHGSTSVRTYQLIGSFEPFRLEAARQWSVDNEQQLLQALTGNR